MAREVDEQTLGQIRVFVQGMIPAVEDGNLARVDSIYKSLDERFNVDGPKAVAVVLAEQIRLERVEAREKLAASQAETLEFQTAYLDQRRRVSELRALLDRTAASNPKRKESA